MAWKLGGKVAKCERREYGFAQLQVKKQDSKVTALFETLGEEMQVRIILRWRIVVLSDFPLGLDVSW